MVLSWILGSLAFLSLVLMIWQWIVGRRFPLHQRGDDPATYPGITLLKPLKGCDESTEACLRSWFTQDYPGEIQIMFGVASNEDPVTALAQKLCEEFPNQVAEVLITDLLSGANAKVSKLLQMQKLAKHDVLIVSDADVWAPPSLLRNISGFFQPRPRERGTGLVCSFYQMANARTLAMHWEGVAINVDFWSQVLQSRSLKPIDFALGAVMAVQKKPLEEIGGFAVLSDCLADDYQLGHRIARLGYNIELSPVVVECRSEPMGWAAVWKHQLRWGRTIRVCQPGPYFFSILSNPTLWPLLWAAVRPGKISISFFVACCLVRLVMAWDLQKRLTRLAPRLSLCWLIFVKDFLQAIIWLLAFAGNRVEWRGEIMKLRPDGTLVKTG